MSGSLNIYPFQDTETVVRFVIQICLFLIGLAITNKMIIKPALKIQAERKKRTLGNQGVAQNKLKHAHELEQAYNARLQEALDAAREAQAAQVKKSKDSAVLILQNAQQKSSAYVDEIKQSLQKERADASSQIHLHINDIVQELYTKLGVNNV